ncbi:proline racemase [Amycolatopsis thailandensis]|uniref:Proline racemase n=1 Tax=Amycolatopsis thailandensis TaxID=589330 RepID=A0A229RRT3_9PSEU|nr:proline racemase family protein [Amycolatopsis thailandensis]OXM49378.1 proline racemase [Amycolatopsis thailandensis]
MTSDGYFAVDYHCGGEPFRIVAEIAEPDVPTVAEKRVAAAADPEIDGLRRLLCSEPRGHADMYGGFLVAPDDPGAHFGVLFWHKDGFSAACGHGTMCLGTWAVRTGLVPADPSGVTDVVIDVPSGRVTARVAAVGAKVTSVDFVSVASYLLQDDVAVKTSRGTVHCVIAFGGAMYAHVLAADFGLAVDKDSLPELIELGREIKNQLNESAYAEHPHDPRLSGIYGVIFFDELGVEENGDIRQRNVTVFADGQVDRSPCGSGTASRVAALHASGRLAAHHTLVHSSIVGSTWHARAASTVEVAGRDAVIPVVSGRAFRTGYHRFVVDPDDDLVPGFVLR